MPAVVFLSFYKNDFYSEKCIFFFNEKLLRRHRRFLRFVILPWNIFIKLLCFILRQTNRLLLGMWCNLKFLIFVIPRLRPTWSRSRLFAQYISLITFSFIKVWSNTRSSKLVRLKLVRCSFMFHLQKCISPFLHLVCSKEGTLFAEAQSPAKNDDGGGNYFCPRFSPLRNVHWTNIELFRFFLTISWEWQHGSCHWQRFPDTLGK